jgi:hypothetical protein
LVDLAVLRQVFACRVGQGQHDRTDGQAQQGSPGGEREATGMKPR